MLDIPGRRGRRGAWLPVYIADLQKGGGHFVSVGADTVNQHFLNVLQASGGYHTIGTAEGQEYFVKW